MKETEGRAAQKRRTRKAIVAAAARLLATGASPSINDVAAEADVSRRTVYMYFPTLEQLLIDASLAAMTDETVGTALDSLADDADIEKRVDVLTRAVQSNFSSTERQGRTLLRLTVDADRSDRPDDEPIRGYRRIEWIERAMSPVRGRLGRKQFERLVSALAMVIGWESLIVARDIRGLTVKEAEDVSAWAARALVRASLDEAPKRPAHKRR
jgi:AcrR family transcriptional regulator